MFIIDSIIRRALEIQLISILNLWKENFQINVDAGNALNEKHCLFIMRTC